MRIATQRGIGPTQLGVNAKSVARGANSTARNAQLQGLLARLQLQTVDTLLQHQHRDVVLVLAQSFNKPQQRMRGRWVAPRARGGRCLRVIPRLLVPGSYRPRIRGSSASRSPSPM